MNVHPRADVYGCLVLAVLWLVAAGCAPRQPSGGEYDSDSAKETLSAALDAWKQLAVSTLASREPPIRFSDEDHAAGCRLVQYELTQPDRPIAAFENVPVTLVLQDTRGERIEKQVAYQITLEPHRAVLRTEP
ncbi:MAG: hypothetical protein KF861_07750 [Planctomycetaceae bacterium]|nr:hypothetical protein [Planctomycetaceae bacterium]